jgi:putative exosortase-associated protein (TIGR04073 family)
MKKGIIFVTILAVLLISSTAHADALRKLGRGIANVITCPFEIIYRIGEANDENGPLAAFTWGTLNGLWRMCVRGVVGVYETVTFGIPLPEEYRPIIDDPEFFMEDVF